MANLAGTIMYWFCLLDVSANTLIRLSIDALSTTLVVKGNIKQYASTDMPLRS